MNVSHRAPQRVPTKSIWLPNPDGTESEFVDIRTIAEEIAYVSCDTVRRWVRAGLVPSRRFGPRRTYIARDDIMRLLAHGWSEQPGGEQ